MLKPISNPPGRFDPSVEWFEPPDPARLQVFEDDSKSILSHNDSPDIPHRYSLNPYRGCTHACAYCYARPSHEYLGFGAGTDHDSKILVKIKAPELLEAEFHRPKWAGESILFSGNTDCYQPLEYRYRLTRACLEVCSRYRNPVAIITKSALIERDLDVLVALHQQARLDVVFSIPFLDPALSRAIEPGAPLPARRFATMRALADAGITIAVNIAPVIPGLSDAEIPGILKAAREAGARHASMLLVRLPGPVEQVFAERLQDTMPGRAETVLNRIRRMRGGELSTTAFGDRMRGQGQEWEALRQMFHIWKKKLGYQAWEPEPQVTTFQRPGQLRLF